MSAVSADPPNAVRSSVRTTWRSAQLAGDRPRRVELDPVALAIIDGQREQLEALLAGKRRADHRIEPARKQHHRGFPHSAIPSLGAAQNIAA